MKISPEQLYIYEALFSVRRAQATSDIFYGKTVSDYISLTPMQSKKTL